MHATRRCGLALLVAAGFALAARGEIIIDDFSAGDVHLHAQNAPGQWHVYLQQSESNLPPDHTIGGTRLTWVETGMDSNPAIADLLNGAMRFQIDNDECQSGLKYQGLGGVDLTEQGLNDRINYDLNYQRNGSVSTVFVYLTLRDTLGAATTLNEWVGTNIPGGGHGGFSGTYGFNLADFAPVDVTRISSIEFRFWGGTDYYGWFETDNLVAVPEPAGLTPLLLMAVLRRRR